MHLPLLTLPFHWDELGQFVPAALDLYRDGAWVPHSTLPNVHPPGVMLITANQNPFPPKYPYEVGGRFTAPYRQRQIEAAPGHKL